MSKLEEALVESNRNLIKRARLLRNDLLDLRASGTVLLAGAKVLPSGEFVVSYEDLADFQRTIVRVTD